MSGPGKHLLIDLGNTRVKWAWQDPSTHKLQGHGAALLSAGWEKLPFLAAGSAAELAVASNVAGQQRAAELTQRVRRRLKVEVRFIRPEQAACGVTNGYSQCQRLGADRWAALIGAWTLERQCCCIVDAGSALTVDLLSGEGRHLGGYIAPGMRMSLHAMAAKTADLASRLTDDSAVSGDLRAAEEYEKRAADALTDDSAVSGDLRPGRDSAAAMQKGVLAAQLGAIRLGLETLRGQGEDTPRVLLTGGDAGLLQTAGKWPNARVVPDLVLRGLAALALELLSEPE